MSLIMRVLITTLVLCGAASAATVTIDDFNSNVSQWKPEMEHGDGVNDSIYNRRNQAVATLLRDAISDRRRISLPWDAA